MPGRGEAALVARAQDGDRDAWGALFERHWPVITKWLRRRVNQNDALADELASDVFYRALNRLGSYRPTGGIPYASWLFAIARNRLIDHYRHAAAHGGGGWSLDRPWMSEAISEGERQTVLSGAIFVDRGLESRIGAADTRLDVRDAIARLVPRQRRVVELRWLYGYSIEDTARRTGNTGEGVKQLQVRAFKKLRALLAPSTAPASVGVG